MNAITADDLEETLVKFVERLFRPDSFGTNQLAMAQPREHPAFIEPSPEVEDNEPGRERALRLRRPPRVVAGWIPRTVTGVIDPEHIPDYPAIIIQVVQVEYALDQALATARLLIGAYDPEPDFQGFKDCLYMCEALALAFLGWRVIDDSYSLVAPVKWSMLDIDTFPHFFAELTTLWQLPTPNWYQSDTVYHHAKRSNVPNLPDY
jgi:hypothetical protein